MHLNNEQLLSPNTSDLQHLQTCKLCQQKFENRKILKKQLKQLPINAAPQHLIDFPLWKEEFNKKQTHKKIKQQSFLQGAGFAFAASIVCVLIVTNFIDFSDKKLNSYQTNQLTSVDGANENDLLKSIIKQNQLLQTKNKSLNVDLTHLVDFSLYRQKINQIDNAIQQAYLNQLSTQEKIKLWQIRLEALKQLNHSHSQKNKTIIKV